MPPVTPSAISISSLTRFLVGLQLFHRLGDHFTLRDGCLLVLADLDSRSRSGKELPGAGAGGDDEFERVGEFATVNHVKVLIIVSAPGRIRSSRARSATTMLRRRSTAAVNSSFTTT